MINGQHTGGELQYDNRIRKVLGFARGDANEILVRLR